MAKISELSDEQLLKQLLKYKKKVSVVKSDDISRKILKKLLREQKHRGLVQGDDISLSEQKKIYDKVKTTKSMYLLLSSIPSLVLLCIDAELDFVQYLVLYQVLVLVYFTFFKINCPNCKEKTLLLSKECHSCNVLFQSSENKVISTGKKVLIVPGLLIVILGLLMKVLIN